MTNFLFYDLETSGLVPEFSQVMQFAAIRTDSELNELSRHQFYVKLNPDMVPDAMAVATHKITPEMTETGLSEPEAIRYIHELMNQPNTCSIGYNSLAFDDNFLRFSFHRNLLDPYSHQFANNCKRADLLLMIVPFYNYFPEVLTWPKPLSLKLEHLASAQGIDVSAAHDAMNDVLATLQLARLLRMHDEKWQYLLSWFDKQKEQYLVNGSPAVWLSHKLGYADNFMAPVIVIGEHKVYKHKLLWRLDDPEWQNRPALEQLRVFRKKPGEGGFLWPYQSRFCPELYEDNLAWCQDNKALIAEYVAPLTEELYPVIPDLDVDAAIYQLGFKSRELKALCARFTLATISEKIDMVAEFPEPYRQQARRIIWRMAPEITDFSSCPRLTHTGKSFPSRLQQLTALKTADCAYANAWAAFIGECESESVNPE